MQAMLAFQNAPPFAAPLRFFLTAPLFSLAAGLLLLAAGPDLLASRWTPGLLAATHQKLKRKQHSMLFLKMQADRNYRL